MTDYFREIKSCRKHCLFSVTSDRILNHKLITKCVDYAIKLQHSLLYHHFIFYKNVENPIIRRLADLALAELSNTNPTHKKIFQIHNISLIFSWRGNSQDERTEWRTGIFRTLRKDFERHYLEGQLKMILLLLSCFRVNQDQMTTKCDRHL